MMSCGHIAERNTAAIYIVGAQEPGIARSMGLRPGPLRGGSGGRQAEICGPQPPHLALPRTFQLGAVSLHGWRRPERRVRRGNHAERKYAHRPRRRPHPVINSSLLGAGRRAKAHGEIRGHLRRPLRAEGLLAGDLIDLRAVPTATWSFWQNPRLRPGLCPPPEAHRRRLPRRAGVLPKGSTSATSSITAERLHGHLPQGLPAGQPVRLRAAGHGHPQDHRQRPGCHRPLPGLRQRRRYALSPPWSWPRTPPPCPSMWSSWSSWAGMPAGSPPPPPLRRFNALRAPGLPPRDGL